ncbi:MAG: DNA translocase FtsK [Planctomycetota bacterium]|nr:DNA translocase FtsK [Planctomycetota bacterium]
MTATSRNALSGTRRFLDFLAVAAGTILAGLGVFLFLSLLSADIALDMRAAAKTCLTGLAGAWMAFGTVNTMGRAASLILAFLLPAWGAHIALSKRFLSTWPQIFGGVLVLAAVSLGHSAVANRYDLETGGLLAVYVSPPALLYFGRWGIVLAAAGTFLLGALLAFGEAAVIAARQSVFLFMDAVFGLAGLGLRISSLFRLLLSPRPALAGAAAAADRVAAPRLGAVTAGAVSGSGAPETIGVIGEEPPPETRPRRSWRLRDRFVSRFLDPEPDGAVADGDGETPAFPEPIAEAVPARPQPETADENENGNGETAGWPESRDPVLEADVSDEENGSNESGVLDGPNAPDNRENANFSENSKNIAEADASPEWTPPIPAAPDREAPAAARPEPRRPIPAGRTPSPEPAAASFSVPAAAGRPSDAFADYVLPSLDLLDPPDPPVVEDRTKSEARARILERTLEEFKIEGRVVHIERGPRITLYEISLAPGIRLNKVTSLADNLAMQLQAESVRIIAPIPGKNTIGIEIPNTEKELVSLRETVEAINREKRRQALPVCLGKDVSGRALVADLARMPHLLIAGATGSGKSVCINSIIMSVMMCCRPDETQLIMVDPKVVELSRFKDIPHLMSPVITDMKRAVAVLEWICQKMDERYEQMSQVSVNNIAKFNALGEDGIRTRLDAFASLEEIEAFPKRLPYMVVIIDELADLMMVAGKEVELHITRLAAKSRAVGIHLILATQRPSVDVITGLIKANMPCRIAFQVASRVDSRTILDQNGAESLLGQGDMLYLPPGVGKLIRAQGVFVSDEELFRTVDFTKARAEPQYHPDLLGPVIGGAAGTVDISSFDELFLESGETIIENQRGSVSLLQRKFGIGYGRASRIIDQLASVGLLGPFRDGKAREILLTLEEFRFKFGGGAGRSGNDEEDSGLAGLREDERGPAPSPWEDEENGE